MINKIDFVLPWVDGSDSEWLKLKRKYEQNGAAEVSCDADANADCHYRDYGILRYWFRAVEKFAPWENRVFFVTCNQKPDWLDESNPKLRLVNHEEYIPRGHLPTFHSNTIELNLHRLADLSEQFVLFNDDIFLLRPVEPKFFFKKGLPVTACELAIPRWLGASNTSRMVLNNTSALKRCVDVEKSIRKNIWKFVDVGKLGLGRAARNLASFAVNKCYIPGTFGHLASSHLKSTFDEIWRIAPSFVEKTSQSRFRSDECVNHWLLLALNMVRGNFIPCNEKHRGAFVALREGEEKGICEAIRRQAYSEICINDKIAGVNCESIFKELRDAFDYILPEKSSFEK